jgi:hypothetical protein
MTKRVVNDDDYMIIPKGDLYKCIKKCKKTPEQKAKEEADEQRDFVIGLLLLFVFIFIMFLLFMSTQHGFYMGADGQWVNY